MSTSAKPAPIKVYMDLDKEKVSILTENRGLSGIYRWVHKESGKSYIGSSMNLSKRLGHYFSYGIISSPRYKMRIHKALLKYGYASFSLEILEYCSIDQLLIREQYYFGVFNPEYNILKVAGSASGYKHSEAAKILISLANKNKIVAESTRDLKRELLLGKTWYSERVDKMRLANPLRKPVILTKVETGETLEFNSMLDAGKFLNTSRTTIRKYLLDQLPYKGYTISQSPLEIPTGVPVSGLVNKDVDSAKPVSTKIINQQPIRLTNKSTNVSHDFGSMTEAAKFLGVTRGALWNFFSKPRSTNETMKGYSVSKMTDTNVKANRKCAQIEVTDIQTNQVKTYPSFTLAAAALGVKPSSISTYLIRKTKTPFKKRYYFKVI